MNPFILSMSYQNAKGKTALSPQKAHGRQHNRQQPRQSTVLLVSQCYTTLLSSSSPQNHPPGNWSLLEKPFFSEPNNLHIGAASD